MPLENAQYISELNTAWPLGTDGVNTSDDHHRNTKTAVQQSLPNISGVVTADQADLNLLSGGAVNGSGLNPVGTVLTGAWTSAPNGYLPCDGAAIDPTYTALIALVGADTPDLQGVFTRGTSPDATVDPDGPRAALTVQAEDLKAHTHTVNGSVNDGNSTSFDQGFDAGTPTSTTSSTGGDETRPVNVALFFAIKW